jgi:tetratricopeptide (TPR) repeat protein
MLVDGLVSEFNLVFLLIALLPLAFLGLMKMRERAWLIGQLAIYACLSLLLIYLLNPSADKQSTDLTRVFFTASHVMVAMCVGYGVALIGSMLVVDYQRYRKYLKIGGTVAALLALYGVAWILITTAFPLDLFRAYFGLAMTVILTGLLLYFRKNIPLAAFMAVVAVTPLYSVMSHWSDNEHRGHLFGFWFGHDMFTPPFTAPDGTLSYEPAEREALLANPESAKLVYPEMAKDAILFGGTDPGRFAPTYMIFCESFIKPEQRLDPNFDRRDVYIITQNALADHTYLSYIRAHYNRSTQIDPPFFQDLLRPQEERGLNVKTNLLARAIGKPLDDYFIGMGESIEKRRRAEGVYPPNEIYTPTPMDSKFCFETYLADAGRRKKNNQLKPGEQVDIVRDGAQEKIQVAGQVSVMAINALLCKVIFDNNPTNEFYIEESFPLDWMFPHLMPFGIIMKINREPAGEFTEEIYQRDRFFWKEYSERLIGNWIDENTTVDEICDFVDEVFIRRDFTNFKGDRKFIRNDQAQKSFSKLRGGIAGLYAFKAGEAPAGSLAQQRAVREAEFAYKQSFAFCPYSPEAAFKYSSLLVNMPGRLSDALRIAETALSIDPLNEQFQYLVDTLSGYQVGETQVPEAQAKFNELMANFQANPMEISNIQPIVTVLMQMQQTNEVLNLITQVLDQPNLNSDIAVQMALFARDLKSIPVMEQALIRLTQVNPESPEAWYDLSALQASIGKYEPAITNLKRSVLLSDIRLKAQPDAKNLRLEVDVEPRFAPLRARSDWDTLLNQQP